MASTEILGSQPQTSDDVDRMRREALITAVLNLQTDDDVRWVNPAWETLQAHYATCGIKLRRVRVKDFDPIELCSKLPECVRVLDQLLTAGHSVYLHCTAGAGRSPTVAVAYLYRCCGWELDEAVAYITQRRQCSPNVEAILVANWGLGGRTKCRPLSSS